MAAPVGQVLGIYQATGSEADALTPGSSEVLYVTGIWIFNGHTADNLVKLFLVDSGGTSYQLYEVNFATKAHEFIPVSLALRHDGVSTDKIRASAGTTATVNIAFFGGK